MLQKLKAFAPARLALQVNDRYNKDGCGQLAAALTYFGFLSIFPLILLGLSAVGFVLAGDIQAQREWARHLSGSVPGLGPLIGDNIGAVVEHRGSAGVFAVIGLLWSGTRLTNASGYALDRIFRRPAHKGFVKQKLWSISTTVLLGTVTVAGVVISATVGGVDASGLLGFAVKAAGFVVAFALDFALFLVSYRVITAGWGPSTRELWRGAAMGAVGWTTLKVAGVWYASRTVSNASEVYGTFGSVVGVLALLYLASRLFLYGAELNAVLCERGGSDMKDREPVGHTGNGHAPSHQSTPQLVSGIATDVGTLVRKEVELARLEIVEGVMARVKAAGAMAAAGILALIAVGFLGLTAADALAGVMAMWTARLIVACGFFALAACVAAYGAMRARRPSLAPEETKRTVKEDVEWAKAQLRR